MRSGSSSEMLYIFDGCWLMGMHPDDLLEVLEECCDIVY